MRVLGIDPGSIRTGYGIVERDGSKLIRVAHGTLGLKAGAPLPERLLAISEGLREVIRCYGPEAVSIESIFFAKNVKSAMQLGQARGVGLLAAASFGLPVYEYAARSVKLAVTGYGNAEKAQVQMMTKVLLKLDSEAQADASDALALAICHIHHLRPAPKAVTSGNPVKAL